MRTALGISNSLTYQNKQVKLASKYTVEGSVLVEYTVKHSKDTVERKYLTRQQK